jgi:hypothetical protein
MAVLCSRLHVIGQRVEIVIPECPVRPQQIDHSFHIAGDRGLMASP